MRRKFVPVDETALRTVYCGIEIVYDERADCWRFTKNGRERSAKTLQDAKKAIMYKDPAEKPAFDVQEAYWDGGTYPWSHGHGEFKIVTVTSVAQATRGVVEMWITDHKKGRHRVGANHLFAMTAANKAKAKAMAGIDRKIEALQKAQSKIAKTMTRLKVPGHDTAAEADDADFD